MSNKPERLPTTDEEAKALNLMIGAICENRNLNAAEVLFVNTALYNMSPSEMARACLFGFKSDESGGMIINPTIMKTFGGN